MVDLGKQARWVKPDPRPAETEESQPSSRGKRRRRSKEYVNHRQRLYHQYNSICWLCGKGNAAEIDHVIPVSQGGSDNIENLRLAHTECNQARNRRSHRWHRVPPVTAEGLPTEWNGLPLTQEMWSDATRARIRRRVRVAGRPESATQADSVLVQRARWVVPEPVDLGVQARWVTPPEPPLGRQARWVDPEDA